MHVLVAEDEPGSRLLLAAAVERLGHRCTQACDGDEALQLFLEHLPEVLITDLRMPASTGPRWCAGSAPTPRRPTPT